ncbi:hypothetical protein SSX86_030415 [Deinandra increscens subsp. villosa]|uniref:Transmembrane protein n=1 Tax=Deinandra increscens subsp. villosa TaxID=3103831 RepID=A0AAP0CAW5_9ASTR
MKFQMLVVFFLLLCAQFLSTLALESKEGKNAIGVNGYSFNKEEGLKRYPLLFSKASRAKGSSNGGQNDHTKKSNAISMFIKPRTHVLDVGIGVIVVCMLFVFDL